jgi:hypothetical protein
LFLLDSLDVLAESPEFQRTTAPIETDMANWYVANFERQHEILWDIAIRDTILPLGFVALVVLSVAAANRVGWYRPAAQLMVLFFAIGGVLHAANDLIYLSELNYWKYSGWTSDPPGPMITVGRATDSIDNLTVFVEAGSYVVLCAAMLCLGRLSSTGPGLPTWLALPAYAEAAGMMLLAVGLAFDIETVFQVGGLATGVLVGPFVVGALGRHLREPEGATA